MYKSKNSKEQSTWLYGSVAPVCFAMTARVVGKFSTDQLKQALAWVGQRHLLLRMRVPDEQPRFIEDASIPLRIVQRKGEQHWQYEVEQELAQPFNWSEAPLVRVVLVHSTDVFRTDCDLSPLDWRRVIKRIPAARYCASPRYT